MWAYDVSRAHVDAVVADGLRVTGAGNFRAVVRATTEAADIPPCDLGIVAVKSEYTRSAIAAAASSLQDAAVASVQNGLGNEERIAEAVPRVIRGTTLAAGAITAPGVVRYDATGGTWLGPFEPQPATMDEVTLLAGLLHRGGMTTQGLADARGAQWTKLLFNVGPNAGGPPTGRPSAPCGSEPRVRALASRLIDEGTLVADALGVELDADPMAMLDDAVGRAYGHRASMLQDVLAHRSTEVDVLNGGSVAAARAVGLDAPLNAAIVDLVHGIELGWHRSDHEEDPR